MWKGRGMAKVICDGGDGGVKTICQGQDDAMVWGPAEPALLDYGIGAGFDNLIAHELY